MNLRTSWSCEGRGASNHRRCSSSSPASHAGASFVASGLSITTPSVIEGARVWSSTTSVSPHDMSHVASMVRVWLLHQRQHQARTADSCSRALSRSSSPSTRTWTESPPGKCAGARRYTVNYHLARVKANLEARSSERDDLTDEGHAARTFDPLALLDSLLFHQRIQRWKNGQSDDSLVNEDGTRGLAWRHELPGDVFECASVDAARALENFSASRRGERSGTPVGFPRFQAKGKVTPRFRLRNRATPAEHHRASHSLQRSFTSPPTQVRPAEALRSHAQGPSHDRRRSLPRLLSHPHPTCGRWTVSLTGVAAELHQAERSRTKRHAIPSESTGDHLPLCRRGRQRCFHRELRGGDNTEASARVTQRGQSGPGQNHTGVKGRQRAKSRLAKRHRKVANTRRHLSTRLPVPG